MCRGETTTGQQQAGIADRLWTVDESVALIEAQELRPKLDMGDIVVGCCHVRQGASRALAEAYRQERGDPYSAFTSPISTTLVAPVIGTITPGDFIINLLPSTRMK